jgi:ABC-type transporter Mla MlaB component
MSQTNAFQVEQIGLTILVTPTRNLMEFEIDGLLNCDPGGAIELLESQRARSVIIDCRNLCRCCSSGIAVFVRLGKRSQTQRGRMAFCNVSHPIRSILEITNLTTMWPVFASMADAIAYVEEGEQLREAYYEAMASVRQ